jgi:hypothetical protein
VRYDRTYWILQEIYQRICSNYYANGEFIKERLSVLLDKRISAELRHLKQKMVTMPILVFPNWSKEFHVHVDASSIALGEVLAQPGEGDIDHALAFSSGKLSTIEVNYTTIEREGLAMVHALQKFHHYLLGGHFKMFTDHSALK